LTTAASINNRSQYRQQVRIDFVFWSCFYSWFWSWWRNRNLIQLSQSAPLVTYSLIQLGAAIRVFIFFIPNVFSTWNWQTRNASPNWINDYVTEVRSCECCRYCWRYRGAFLRMLSILLKILLKILLWSCNPSAPLVT
jgi:hypothetical protein